MDPGFMDASFRDHSHGISLIKSNINKMDAQAKDSDNEPFLRTTSSRGRRTRNIMKRNIQWVRARNNLAGTKQLTSVERCHNFILFSPSLHKCSALRRAAVCIFEEAKLNIICHARYAESLCRVIVRDHRITRNVSHGITTVHDTRVYISDSIPRAVLTKWTLLPRV